MGFKARAETDADTIQSVARLAAIKLRSRTSKSAK